MNGSHWAQLLELFFRMNVPAIAPATVDPDEGHPFVLMTDLDPPEAALAIQYLWQTGLVERLDLDSDTQSWRLTEKGFNVAHERQIDRTHQEILERQNDAINAQNSLIDAQHETSKKSTHLAGYLVIAIIVQVLATITGGDSIWIPLLVFLVVILVVGELNREQFEDLWTYLRSLSPR